MRRPPGRPLRPEEARLWALVARTVRRAPHAAEPALPAEAAPTVARETPPPHRSAPRPRASLEAIVALAQGGVGHQARMAARAATTAPQLHPIEPNRKRRIARAREPIGARLDLHGHDQDRARAALHAFIAAAQAEGARAVLVITGKGETRGGILRARVPEWLAEPPSRARVAGVSPAEPRRGGQGALYVALKRAAD